MTSDLFADLIALLAVAVLSACAGFVVARRHGVRRWPPPSPRTFDDDPRSVDRHPATRGRRR